MKTEEIKIIVIDDDPFSMAITEETIKRIFSGEQIISFASAAHALQYLETESATSANDTCYPGMILSDLHMPGIDGFQFLDEFAKLSSAVRKRYCAFILSSTSNREELAKLSEKACLAGFCSKPLTTQKLLKLLETTYYEFQKKNPGYT